MATNQNEEFVLLYGRWRTTQQTFIENNPAKIPAVRPTFTFLIISQWKI